MAEVEEVGENSVIAKRNQVAGFKNGKLNLRFAVGQPPSGSKYV